MLEKEFGVLARLGGVGIVPLENLKAPAPIISNLGLENTNECSGKDTRSPATTSVKKFELHAIALWMELRPERTSPSFFGDFV